MGPFWDTVYLSIDGALLLLLLLLLPLLTRRCRPASLASHSRRLAQH